MRRGEGGVVYLSRGSRSGRTPTRLTRAARALGRSAPPERAFLAQRTPLRRVAHAHVRGGARGRAAHRAGARRAAALAGAAARDPVGQRHRARAAGARGDARGVPVRAARAGLLAAGARLRGTLRQIVAPRAAARVRGGGAEFEPALGAVLPAGTELVVSSSAPEGLRSHAVRRARGDTRDRRRRRGARARRAGQRSPRSSSPRARPAGRRASSTPSACSAPTRR